MANRVTAADVAKRAGVSRATVSYVLNGRADQSISERTTRAVQRAAADLSYRPNPFAQSLKRGRGGTVLFPLPAAPMVLVLADAIDSCSAALSAAGLTLVADATRYDSPEARTDAWMRLRPAAVIDVFMSRDEAAVEPLVRAGAVLLTSTAGAPGDQSAAEWVVEHARQAQVDYVVDRGHRHILLAGPGAPDRKGERRLRRIAQDAVSRVGGTLDIHRAPLTRAGVASVVEGWSETTSRADAICAANDEFAIALLNAFAARGIRVPDDVAVIGVDDIPLAAASTPPLTTVAGDFGEWGAAVASLVRDALDGQPGVVGLPPLETRVVVRQSA